MYTFFVLIKWIVKICFLCAILFVCSIFFVKLITTPSNIRNWNDDQDILPYAQVQDNIVSIYNVRNFTYASTTAYTKGYYNKTFDVQKLKKIWYIVEPFSGIPGSAHTFLSFEFEDDSFVTVSVEIRKERGEAFHPIKGLFNQYEIMYVIADERDAVKLRTNYRHDSVYVYPVKTDPEKAQKLFLNIMKRVNGLKDNPEFYNTITNTCTTNIVRHVNEISPGKLPAINLQILFPEDSDKLAYSSGLLDIEVGMPFSEIRNTFYINDKALEYAEYPDFSAKIRGR